MKKERRFCDSFYVADDSGNARLIERYRWYETSHTTSGTTVTPKNFELQTDDRLAVNELPDGTFEIIDPDEKIIARRI